MKNSPDKEIVWVRVPLDGATAELLHSLADTCHAEVSSIAAAILHDVVRDDAEAHGMAGIPPAEQHRLN